MRLFGKKKKDEYDEIYEQYKDSGFKFNYKNNKISKSESMFKDEMNEVPSEKFNEDSIGIRCSRCDVYMDFIGNTDGSLGGKWVCPICGAKVRESTPYSQLERENDDFLNSLGLDDDYDDIY